MRPGSFDSEAEFLVCIGGAAVFREGRAVIRKFSLRYESNLPGASAGSGEHGEGRGGSQ